MPISQFKLGYVCEKMENKEILQMNHPESKEKPSTEVKADTKQQASNIIFILSDDHGCWGMGCAGNCEIRTPNLDRLAATGVLFNNFFCVSPVCSPARASILTGCIPSQHGVHDWLRAGDTIEKYEPARNGKLIEYLRESKGYTDILASNGYTCGISGKWHLGDSHHPQKGFSFWRLHARGGWEYYNAPMIKNGELYEESRYVTDVITDNALEFLESRKDNNEPFYLGVHYTAPHALWSRENHPHDIYDEYHKNCEFNSVPDNITPAEWIKEKAIPVDDEKTRREYLSGYYAATTAMDNNIGRILDYLENNGLREDTLIIFSSDNGMNMGHHGIYGKGNATTPLNMYEESVKVPFIMSQPGNFPEDSVCSDLLSHYDVMPTLLEYAGLPDPDAGHKPGHSFLPLLQGKTSGKSNPVVIFDEYGPVRMIRTDEWKYIHRYPEGPHELYNLKDNPEETANLADSPEYKDKLCELRRKLGEWFEKYVVSQMDGTLFNVTGNGQIGKIGEDREISCFKCN